MNKVIYNGVDLTTLGLYVSGDKAFSSPEKDYEKVSIPGRSGDLFFWNGRYNNVDVSYNAILLPTPLYNSTSYEEKFRQNARAIKQTLLSAEGYVKIVDDYNPDEYRLGVFTGPMDIDAVLLQAGTSTLKFNCRPERFLVSGNSSVNVSSSGNTITNPTSFLSKPLIEITYSADTQYSSNFAITINNNTLTVSNVEGLGSNVNHYIYIDCDAMQCYDNYSTRRLYNSSGTYIYDDSDSTLDANFTYKNSDLTVDEFPVLNPGSNTAIRTYSTATSHSASYGVRLVPRWYTL